MLKSKQTMIIVLHGEDTFRSRYKLKELENAYKKKHASGFSFEKLYAENIVFKEFKNIVQSRPLFDEYKFVVLEDLSENTALKKEITEWEELGRVANNKNALIIFYESKSVLKDAQYKIILELSSKKQEFKKLSSVEQAKWFILNIFPREEASKDTIQEIVKLCRQDMWRAYNELNKIFTYAGGKNIQQTDIQILNIGAQEANIFPTIDAIFEGKTDKAFQNILIHWKKGEVPEYMFYMIERQLKLLALVSAEKDAGVNLLAKKLNLHPFVVQKTLRFSQGFPWSKIKDLYGRVESLDSKYKIGRMSPYLACELLVVAIAS